MSPHARARARSRAHLAGGRALRRSLRAREPAVAAGRPSLGSDAPGDPLAAAPSVDPVDRSRRSSSSDMSGLADATARVRSRQGQRKLVGVARALAARPQARLPRRARRRARHRARARASAAPAPRSSTAGRRCCSSTTTWGSCSASATTSSCSTSAGSSPAARPRRSRGDPRVVEAYLGERGRSVGRRRAVGGGARERVPLSIEGLTAGYDGAPVVRGLGLTRRRAARSSRCSARTAPARRRRCASISGLVRPMAGSVTVRRASTSPGLSPQRLARARHRPRRRRDGASSSA